MTTPACSPICAKPGCNVHVAYSKWTRRWNLYCSKKCTASANSLAGLEKRKKTCRRIYGNESPQKTDTVKKRAEETNCTRYGCHPSQLSKTHDKIRDTTRIRWGVDNASQSDIIKDKKIKTTIAHYGVPHHRQAHLGIDVVNKAHSAEWVLEENKSKPLVQIASELGYSSSAIYKIMEAAGKEYKRYSGYSTAQNELCEILRGLAVGEVVSNDRVILNGQELDILLLDKAVAFEMNGTYWHTESRGKDSKYHLTKINKCLSAGIRLIHISDIDWATKHEIVLSRISAIFGKLDKIYARKTDIRKLTEDEERCFFNKTHLQEYVPSKICYGLFYDNQCVSAMSFAFSKFNKTDDWELLRYSSELYTTVIGGASRLLLHFIKDHNPVSIISYSDKRWNTAGVYTKMGFRFSHSSLPEYAYLKNGVLYNCDLFRKKMLLGKLEIFDASLTEWQNMQNNGYDRIWDCGNDVFIWTA